MRFLIGNALGAFREAPRPSGTAEAGKRLLGAPNAPEGPLRGAPAPAPPGWAQAPNITLSKP